MVAFQNEAVEVIAMPPQRDANGRFLAKGAQPTTLPPGGFVDKNGRVRNANGRFVKGGGGAGGVQITDKDTGFKALQDWHKRNAGGAHIDVGFFAEKIATYAAANEFGTATIPERSFIRSTFDEETPKLQAMLDAAVIRAQEKNIDLVDALIAPANYLRTAIINKIQSGVDPANAPSTVARKGSNTPLVHTGQMQQALSWRTSAGKIGGGVSP